MVKRLLSSLYTIYVGIVFIVFMFLFMPIMLIPLLIKKEGNWLSFLGFRAWALSFHYLTFIHYKVEGRENLNPNVSYIYTPNHTSFLDIPAIPLIVQHAFKPLAKKEVRNIPIFGPFASLITVMVDRSDPASRRQSIIKLAHVLKAGTSLVIYPEGTVNKSNMPLNKFYDGAFRIAVATNAPIVPVVILGANKLMPAKQWKMKPGTIRIKILPPIETTDLKTENVNELKDKIYSQMEQEIITSKKGKPEPVLK